MWDRCACIRVHGTGGAATHRYQRAAEDIRQYAGGVHEIDSRDSGSTMAQQAAAPITTTYPVDSVDYSRRRMVHLPTFEP
jgi:hypothetical protein